jgi:phage terminase large subunit-like protein
MVRSTLQCADSNVLVKLIHASRGKWTRTEPVSALYEQQRVHHVGQFAALEDGMLAFAPDGKANGVSPNRLDATVYGLTELILRTANTGFFGFMDALAAGDVLPIANADETALVRLIVPQGASAIF